MYQAINIQHLLTDEKRGTRVRATTPWHLYCMSVAGVCFVGALTGKLWSWVAALVGAGDYSLRTRRLRTSPPLPAVVPLSSSVVTSSMASSSAPLLFSLSSVVATSSATTSSSFLEDLEDGRGASLNLAGQITSMTQTIN